MDGNFVLRTGKYAGKTVDWIRENNPMYLVWVEENQPNMLKETKTKIVQSTPVDKNKILPEKQPDALSPNMNFFNEPPEEQSLKYINKQKSANSGETKVIVETTKPTIKKEDDDWNF